MSLLLSGDSPLGGIANPYSSSRRSRMTSPQMPVVKPTMGGFAATTNQQGTGYGRPGRAQPLRSPWPSSMNAVFVPAATPNVKPGYGSRSWSGTSMGGAPSSASIPMGRKGTGGGRPSSASMPSSARSAPTSASIPMGRKGTGMARMSRGR